MIKMKKIDKSLSGDSNKNNSPSNLNQIDLNNYERLRVIKTDSKFRYYEIIEKKTKEKYIAKVLNIPEDDITKVKNFLREIELTKSLDSPFLLKTIGYSFLDFDGDQNPTIILEYASNGTLQDLIKKYYKGLAPSEWNETKKLMIIYGIASGMEYLHSKKIIHSSLKPENIFLDDYLLPKIANFYDSKINSEDYTGHSLMVGTPMYMAPEIIKEEEYDESVDVYSFSMVLHEIITGTLPKGNIMSLIKGKRLEIHPHIPDNYKRFIERCWIKEERPTFKEIVSLLKTDYFLTENIDKEEYFEFIESIESSQFDFNKIQIDILESKKLDVEMDQINLKLYEQMDFVGKGQYGMVFKVKEKKSGEIFAAKINIMLLEDCNLINIYSLSREINILSRLNHPSILKYIGYCQKDFNDQQHPIILTEFIKNNTLENIIKLQNRALTPHEWNATKILITIYGIALGMAYLHSKDILHRDLKPANIFLDEHLFPKIGDFGLAKEINDNSQLEAEMNVGTPAFMSPEIFESFIYSKAGDVYAFAMLMYQLITLDHPFNGLTSFQVYRSVISGIRPKFNVEIPVHYKKLIEKCWSQNPDDRYTFDEIVNILENDDDFISKEIDENQFFEFVNYMKNKKVKKSFDEIIIDFDELKRSQLNDPSLNISNLDLKKFTKQTFIRRIENFEIYEIKNNDTNELYEAKISINSFNELTTNETIHLQREVNILSKLNHPSFLKFIGFSLCDFMQNPMPVIVTEMPPNKSLKIILNLERNNEHIKEWDDTRKLISIFGIASGMAYLHSHKIVHRNLTPESVFFDEYLFPKIGNFGLLTQIHSIKTMTNLTSIGIKGNLIYSSPELLESNDYSKSSDVYAFALIVYEIMTLNVPFENINNYKQIFNEVVTKENRPKFDTNIDDHYRKLIEICWSQNPDERPSFEEIVYVLKNDSGFISKGVDMKIFLKYVDFIEKSKIKFYSKNRVVKFDDLIKKKSSKEKEDERDDQNKNDSKSKLEPKEKEKDNLDINEDKLKVKNENKFKKSLDDLLNKKYIDVVNSEFIDYLFKKSQPVGSSLTTLNFKVQNGQTTNDTDFVLLKLFKKKIYKKNSDDEEIDIKKIQEFIKVYNIVNELNHPNVIKSFGYFNGNKNQAPAVIYEFYSRRLKDVIKTIDEAYLITIIYEIGHAMMIAHKNNLIHRNLNTYNIYIDFENHAKIDDFGFPVLMDSSEQINLTDETLFCLSQQLLQNKKYNEKVDVFAFGMLMMFILRRGKKPFLTRDEIFDGKKARIPKSLNKLAFSIVSKCLSHSEDERPSFKAIVQTIKRHDFELIDGIGEKIQLIQNQLKSIIKMK